MCFELSNNYKVERDAVYDDIYIYIYIYIYHHIRHPYIDDFARFVWVLFMKEIYIHKV
jgi:hypothetical protein